jgi:uncharacterized RDD family membrane protein YckC
MTGPGAAADGLEYVGFWLRVVAAIIDTVLISIIIFPILWAVYGPAYFSSDRLIQGPIDFLVSWVLPAVALVLFWIARQATPGKMAIGARIVDAATGGKPTAAQLVVRYLGYYVSMIPLFLGIVWVAFDRRKQGWHDKLARTVVVRPQGGGVEPVRFG